MAASGSVAAGEPQEVEPQFEQISLGEFVTGGSDEVYMIRADGDSMEAEIRSGDWLIVNRHLQCRAAHRQQMPRLRGLILDGASRSRQRMKSMPSSPPANASPGSARYSAGSCAMLAVLT